MGNLSVLKCPYYRTIECLFHLSCRYCDHKDKWSTISEMSDNEDVRCKECLDAASSETNRRMGP